jgi:hypothetical protein
MKTRQGFVSNSSSSSYVCAVTYEAIVCGDDCYREDAVCQCLDCGNAFSGRCIISGITAENYLEIFERLKEHYIWYRLTTESLLEKMLEVLGNVKNSNDEFYSEVQVVKEMCPVCRLDGIPSEELIRYIWITKRDLFLKLRAEIKDKYENYQAFKEALEKLEISEEVWS